MCLNFFLIFIGEEYSQATKHANKIILLIWLWRPQSLTHTACEKIPFWLETIDCEVIHTSKEIKLRYIEYYYKALFIRDILAHNISIKRYWDKKIKRHFSSNIFFLCELKIFISVNVCIESHIVVWKDFEMPLQYVEEKSIFLPKCLFFFLSQYRNIVHYFALQN